MARMLEKKKKKKNEKAVAVAAENENKNENDNNENEGGDGGYTARRLVMGTADKFLTSNLQDRFRLRAKVLSETSCPCVLARALALSIRKPLGPVSFTLSSTPQQPPPPSSVPSSEKRPPPFHGVYFDVWPEMRPAVRRAVAYLRWCGLNQLMFQRNPCIVYCFPER